MRVGIDYRAVTAAPLSGIGRQTSAFERAVPRHAGAQVLRYTAAPLEHPHRAQAACPPWATPAHGLHRLGPRLRFEGSFLPEAIARDELDVYVATANMGLPLRRPKRRTRLAQILHDTFQITERNRHASRLREHVYRMTDRLSIAHGARWADAIWVPSRYSADCMSRLFPAATARIHLLPNAVPFEAWQVVDEPPPAGLPAPGYWLAVGTSEPRKNMPWFVRTWQQARRGGTVPELVLVGHPDHLPAELASLPGLHILRGLSDRQMATVYRRAARLWHPSYAEGFGLPVIEAAASATPVATAQGSSLDEITPPGAPRFDPHDAKALLELMHALARGPLRGDGESQETLQAWARRYDTPHYAERVAALLAGLAS